MKVGTHSVAQYGDVISVWPVDTDVPMDIVRERLELKQGKVIRTGNKRWVLFKSAGEARHVEVNPGGDYDPLHERRMFGIKQDWDAVYAGRWP